MTLTQFLAVWGTIVSSIALTWNIIRGLQDKRKLKVEAFIGVMIPRETDKKYITVTVTNIGRRPIYVIGWGARLKKEKGGPKKPSLAIGPHILPKMLAEGEYVIEYTHDLTMLLREIKYIYAWDSTGKQWRVKRNSLNRLIKEGREILEEANVNR